MKTKSITISGMLIAIGTLSAHLVYIPVGPAKCFPIQHAINVISAVLLGPVYGVINAFTISLLRNILGTGSPLAFPGSILGALLAGCMYRYFGNKLYAAIGEVVGTGIVGALVAFPIAKFFLGQEVGAYFFMVPFLTSAIGGSIVGYLLLKSLEALKLSDKINI